MVKNIKKLIVIYGGSCVGKTWFAKKLQDKYGYSIIHMDNLYYGEIVPEVSDKNIGELDNKEKVNYLKNQKDLTDTVIVEGWQLVHPDERQFVVDTLKPENVFYIKITAPATKSRIVAKYKGDTNAYENGLKRVNKMYKKAHGEIKVHSWQRMLWVMQNAILNKYVYQDHVLMRKKIRNFKFDFKDKSVVDIGCNAGKLNEHLFKLGITGYEGFDIDSDIIEIAKQRYPDLNFYVMDLLDYDKKHDVTMAMAVFHHLKDKKLIKALKHYSGLSKEMIFEVPAWEGERDIYNLRTVDDYIKLVNEHYGEVVRHEASGATNDIKPRTIFVCKTK